MRINFAHLRVQGIDVAVFGADATTRRDADRAKVLARFTAAARAKRLKIDKSALMIQSGAGTQFYGTPDLVRYLATAGWSPGWTHWIDV